MKITEAGRYIVKSVKATSTGAEFYYLNIIKFQDKLWVVTGDLSLREWTKIEDNCVIVVDFF